jgi:hypothetical protein
MVLFVEDESEQKKLCIIIFFQVKKVSEQKKLNKIILFKIKIIVRLTQV